jgi:hypothetical protein
LKKGKVMKIELFFGGGKLRGTRIPPTPPHATALRGEGVSIPEQHDSGWKYHYGTPAKVPEVEARRPGNEKSFLPPGTPRNTKEKNRGSRKQNRKIFANPGSYRPQVVGGSQ